MRENIARVYATDSVFLLWYVHAPDTDAENEFLIGAYRTEQDAKDAVERLKNKSGFANAPGGFQIDRYELNKDHWTDGFVLAAEH
jgi:hypothetical protein